LRIDRPGERGRLIDRQVFLDGQRLGGRLGAADGRARPAGSIETSSSKRLATLRTRSITSAAPPAWWWGTLRLLREEGIPEGEIEVEAFRGYP
jgi:hypothetical protein